MSARELRTLAEEIETCRRCPRLVTWREKVARTKRRAYADEAYWGRPVAGFGDPRARIVLVGLGGRVHMVRSSARRDGGGGGCCGGSGGPLAFLAARGGG